VVQAKEISHLVAQLTDRESGDEGGKQSSDSIASLSSNNSGSTPAVAEKRNSFESTRPHLATVVSALGVCLPR
jgi:hypothetical protein